MNGNAHSIHGMMMTRVKVEKTNKETNMLYCADWKIASAKFG